MGAEQILTNILGTSPMAAVLFWFAWKNMKKVDEKDEQQKQMTDRVITAFENNTSAIKSFEKTQEETQAVMKSLNTRIYDVLTKHG